MKRRAEGFTLVEMAIVVSVIGILMAVSIPVLSNARMRANEGSAVSSLRTITSANQTYRTRFGTYAGVISDLSNALIIDEVLGSSDGGTGKSGYVFNYTGSTDIWEIEATPLDPGISGQRHFYVDTSGVIRFEDMVAATSTSSPIK